jgi:hypothetical protein
MRKLFVSLNGVLTLSALALLAFIGYCLMEMRYFLARWIPGDNAAMLEVILILLLAGGWLWALFAAAGGRRGGVITLLVLALVTALIGPYDFRYFPIPWPEETMVIVSFGLSLIAAVALAFQLRRWPRG